MMKHLPFNYLLMLALHGTAIGTGPLQAQAYNEVSVLVDQTHQTVEGFGASLAYYESWLIAHPRKAEIYEVVFAELSLDILRVRNAFDYDAGMIDRVSEFVTAANNSLGKPIAILSCSWGPPGYLKSNGTACCGGTLKYTVDQGGVVFDYAGFADWWNRSLDDYAAHGIYPTYISIQNEPDWTADWETCLFNYLETVYSKDTVAGYNKALDAVYDTLSRRERMPRILGAETAGIGYNSVENYGDALDLSKIYGIAHHLYNGVDENDPYASTNFLKVGNFHPEIPHFQTEFSGGDWFALGGLIYKTFHDENAVAYLYWDLIWDDGGLVDLDFPWDPGQWSNPNGYTRTKDFYAFKQFSALIHPGWQRTGTTPAGNTWKTLAFTSPDRDSAAVVVINQSPSDSLRVHLAIPGYSIGQSSIYFTSGTQNFKNAGELKDSLMKVPPRSITTVALKIAELPAYIDCNGDTNGLAIIDSCGTCAGGNTGLIPVLDKDNCANRIYSEMGDFNGVSLRFDRGQERMYIRLSAEMGMLQMFDISGKKLIHRQITRGENPVDVSGFEKGLYIVRVVYDKQIFNRKITL